MNGMLVGDAMMLVGWCWLMAIVAREDHRKEGWILPILYFMLAGSVLTFWSWQSGETVHLSW